MLHFTWDQDFPMSLVCAAASSDVKRAARAKTDLIFVTDIIHYICGEESVMWKNFKFL